MSLFRRATVAVVTVTRTEGREAVDSEVRVRTLAQLFEACRAAPPSQLVRISITGREGEVHLNFASFLRKRS